MKGTKKLLSSESASISIELGHNARSKPPAHSKEIIIHEIFWGNSRYTPSHNKGKSAPNRALMDTILLMAIMDLQLYP